MADSDVVLIDVVVDLTTGSSDEEVETSPRKHRRHKGRMSGRVEKKMSGNKNSTQKIEMQMQGEEDTRRGGHKKRRKQEEEDTKREGWENNMIDRGSIIIVDNTSSCNLSELLERIKKTMRFAQKETKKKVSEFSSIDGRADHMCKGQFSLLKMVNFVFEGLVTSARLFCLKYGGIYSEKMSVRMMSIMKEAILVGGDSFLKTCLERLDFLSLDNGEKDVFKDIIGIYYDKFEKKAGEKGVFV